MKQHNTKTYTILKQFNMKTYNPSKRTVNRSDNFSITMNIGIGRKLTKSFKTAEELYDFCVSRRPEWFRGDVAKMEKEWVNTVK